MTDAYRECLDFLYGRLNFERSALPRGGGEFRLERMRRLLRRLGDPHRSLRIVHVAGTKGKGSTSAMLSAALTASGRKTGLFCSPHLHRLEERFRIDGHELTEAGLVALVESVRPAVADFDARAHAAGDRGATFFEVTTAMGLVHFEQQGTDLAVVEVGVGGRLDSTNVVRPLLSIITSISFDHTRVLGRTLGAIATEKAGIIKHRTPVLSGVVEEEPRSVIRDVARLRQSTLRELGADFRFDYVPPPAPILAPGTGTFDLRTWRNHWGPLRLPVAGRHQAHNAALALAALDVLDECGIDVGTPAVRRAFEVVRIPARVEVLGASPWIVVDGAHNVAAAGALAETLATCFPPVPRTLIFGTTREKDLAGQLNLLVPMFDRCVATRYLENPRAVDPEEVATVARALGARDVRVAAGPAQALDVARAETPADGLICVSGSMFLAAEARSLLLGLRPSPLATPVPMF